MTGMIYYRQDTNPTNIKKAENEIYNAFPNITQININWLLITTWYNVTYYQDNLPDYYYKRRDTFQAILATNGAQSFAIFYYNNITWTTGDASGGVNGLGGRKGQNLVLVHYLPRLKTKKVNFSSFLGFGLG
jgi:alpha-tectorin